VLARIFDSIYTKIVETALLALTHLGIHIIQQHVIVNVLTNYHVQDLRLGLISQIVDVDALIAQ